MPPRAVGTTEAEIFIDGEHEHRLAGGDRGQPVSEPQSAMLGDEAVARQHLRAVGNDIKWVSRLAIKDAQAGL
ncbi:MAG: hypothetical protein ACK4TL_20290 [Hyphomicrobiaceae bacterium]